MIMRIVVFFIVIAIFCGCGTTIKQSGRYTGGSPILGYVNSDVFDKDISRLMKANHREIKVTQLMNIDINNIPERLDKWFNIIYGYGGKVEYIPNVKGPADFVFDFFEGIFDRVRKNRLYKPAKNYNVDIIYKYNTGIIDSVYFTQKVEQEDH